MNDAGYTDLATPAYDKRNAALMFAAATSRVVALAVVCRGSIVVANPAFRKLFLAADTLTGVELSCLVAESERDRLVDTFDAVERAPVELSLSGVRADGTPFDLELHIEKTAFEGQPAAMVFATDVTERRRSATRLSYLAYSDALTGLANRSLFIDRLRQALVAARRDGTILAVLMVDLDGFKAVNDSWGHDMGDVVLRVVAQRFHACVRETDTIARLGGDEFAVLLPRLEHVANAAVVAGGMLQALHSPIDHGGSELTMGTSIGIAACPEHANSIDSLLAAADTALYRAKREGRNRYAIAAPRAGVARHSLLPLVWSVAHEVGVKEIDEQHATMTALINELSLALKEDHNPGTIVRRLGDLAEFTDHHFATEERLMLEYDVRGAEAHRDKHRRLLDDIRTLSLDRDVPSLSLILRYLQEWLLRHVEEMDRPLGRALMAKGVS